MEELENVIQSDVEIEPEVSDVPAPEPSVEVEPETEDISPDTDFQEEPIESEEQLDSDEQADADEQTDSDDQTDVDEQTYTVSGNDISAGGPELYSGDAVGFDMEYMEAVVERIEYQTDIIKGGFIGISLLVGVLVGIMFSSGFRLRRV